jgi:hypothetical protein
MAEVFWRLWLFQGVGEMPTITLFPRQIARYLLGVALIFDALSFLTQFPEYAFGYALPQKVVEFFHVGGEYNPQAWYSSLLLVLCALLLFLISLADQERMSNQVGYWRGLSFIFFYLAMDEMLLLHERGGEWLSTYIQMTGIFRYTWVMVAIPICLLIGAVYIRFLFRLPQRIRRLFIASACIYVGGALGFELVSGFVASIHGEKTVYDFLLVAIEEFLEKFGVIFFIYALLLYMALYIKAIHVRAG